MALFFWMSVVTPERVNGVDDALVGISGRENSAIPPFFEPIDRV